MFSLAAEKRKLFGSMADSNNARLNLPEDSDWFAPSTMKAYFCQLYSRKQTFDEKDIKHWLYKPTELCFETASKEFRLIDDTSINVIVNWENGHTALWHLYECSLCTTPYYIQTPLQLSHRMFFLYHRLTTSHGEAGHAKQILPE